MVTGAEWLKQHVPEGDNLTNVGSQSFLSFGASDNKHGTLVELDRGIMTMFKKIP